MAYSADSFTAGEQPTTAKWNKLWTNDASFNDGTGIASLEIGSGHTSLKNDYKFFVYRNAAFGIGATTESKIPFDTKLFDTGSNFDAVTNNRFTAPVAGFYVFGGAIGFSTFATVPYIVDIYKNGSQYARMGQEYSGPVNGNNLSIPISSPPIQLAATDFIEVFAYNGGSGTASVLVGSAPVQSFVGGFLLSQT